MVFSNNLLMGAAGQASGYEIDQSIRFDKTTSSHLSKTYGSAGDRKTWTFSTWFKRGKIDGTRQILFAATGQAYLQVGPDAASREMITILNEGSGTDLNWYTTQVFRDASAWYHLVWQFDSTQATADDRTKLYINGSQVTDFTKAATPAQNFEGAISNAVEHKIGEGHTAANYFDGYQAEIHFIDGTALDPTSFGETNDDGVWIPKAYSGAYGTNGFYITGETASDLGEDFSGNNNDFTSSGLTTADQMSDSPTNNHCTLNPLWVDAYTLSDGNLVASAAADSAAIGTMAFDVTDSSGFYFEAKVTTAATYPNVGIRTVESPSQVGAVSTLSDNSTGRYAFTGSSGDFNDAGSGSSYGSAWAGTADKVIGVLVKAGALYFSIDGVIQNSGTAAKTGLTGLMLPTVFYDAGSGTAAAWELRFDASDWGTTPSGYKAINTANLPTPSIKDGSKYFQTTLYTGNGTAIGSGGLEVNQSGNSTFQPDFSWIKNRTTAGNEHDLYDAVRGVTKAIFSSATSAEATVTEGLTAFDADGFTVGNRGEVNTSGNSMVAWQWLANNTTGSTNDDGSVDSTVAVNTTAGFSIVKWVHTTASNYTVGHGLGATPKMILVKTLDQGTNWGVYHSDITVGNRLILNTTAAQGTGYWGANTWNSTVFSIGSVRDANSSNAIAYAFAEIPGYSSIGSYVGNGSTDGPFVATGFKPSWLMIKRASGGTGNWDMFDNQRDPINVVDAVLDADANSAEATYSTIKIDFLGNGFKVRGTQTNINGSGSTYIYMAFAEHPFGGDGAAPATAR